MKTKSNRHLGQQISDFKITIYLSTPTLRYCHEMYGGQFKQYYGWYINQTALRLGIRGTNYLPNITPDEIIYTLIKLSEQNKIRNRLTEMNNPFNRENFLQINEMEKSINKLGRQIENKIENITRQEFGYRKIGEGNVSEYILIKIVSLIFKDEEIKAHYRPKWLEGLELDIFVTNKKIGIEYQGQQHFHPIKAWGGERALRELRERDHKKRKLCQKYGIKLIEFDYTEPLEYKYVKNKIFA